MVPVVAAAVEEAEADAQLVAELGLAYYQQQAVVVAAAVATVVVVVVAVVAVGIVVAAVQVAVAAVAAAEQEPVVAELAVVVAVGTAPVAEQPAVVGEVVEAALQTVAVGQGLSFGSVTGRYLAAVVILGQLEVDRPFGLVRASSAPGDSARFRGVPSFSQELLFAPS